MIFDWLKRRRRKRVLESPVPETWRAVLAERVRLFASLPPEDRDELLRHVQVLLAEKHFEGCGGFEITEEARLTIAGHAALLLLHRDADYFPRLKTVLVYPSTFMVNHPETDEAGVVEDFPDAHAGESWDLGVIVLAWDEVEKSGRHLADGYNVVLHEFAHQLDSEDGTYDGTPVLETQEAYNDWSEVFGEDYERHIRAVHRGRHTVIDEYGAESPSEFFAVATETFFERPLRLSRRHPDLYRALSDYYRQDPAALLRDSK